ncbi:MAG: hypothetical protein ABDH28_02985 [Brevinematia bacterium]
MKKYFPLLTLCILTITPACNIMLEEKYVFDKDFLFDDFNELNPEVWEKIDNTHLAFSSLKKDNVLISNGNLVIKIPQNTTEGGGILSLKKFPYGKFSIYALNTLTNVVSELEINSRSANLKVSLRYYFLNSHNTNIVECEVISPLTNITVILSNSFRSNKVLLTIKTLQDKVSVFFDSSEILNFTNSTQIEYVEVRISSYLREYDTQPFNREVLVDYFSYERN